MLTEGASPKKNNQAKPIAGRGGYRPSSGRPKGVPNKTTAEIKAIAQHDRPDHAGGRAWSVLVSYG